MSPFKEPNFFAYEKHKAEDFDIAESRYHFEHESVTDIEDYTALFKDAAHGQIKGETSNTYLYSPLTIDSIKSHIPDTKIIAIFRQPAERLYSRYLHLARENMLPTKEFTDLFDKSTIWWSRPDLINEGFYYKHLSKFYEAFPAENIKVVLYEDLKEDVDALMRSIYEFIGVDSDFKTDTETVFNKSGFVKNKALNNLVGPNGVIIKAAKSVAPALAKWARSNDKIYNRLMKTRESNLSRPKLDPELRKRIVDEIYIEDIQQLEKLINRNLSHWY